MAPLRSRARISAITSSGTCEGSSPHMTSLMTPGHRRTQRNCRSTGRCVQSATVELGRLVIVFDDRSTMTVKTAGIATEISTGAKVKAVLENGDQCILHFEDGSSVTVKLAQSGRIRCGS
jgi:hypothetical protein